jgi:hypothetical protein
MSREFKDGKATIGGTEVGALTDIKIDQDRQIAVPEVFGAPYASNRAMASLSWRNLSPADIVADVNAMLATLVIPWEVSSASEWIFPDVMWIPYRNWVAAKFHLPLLRKLAQSRAKSRRRRPARFTRRTS